jgi:hypothetical protein
MARWNAACCLVLALCGWRSSGASTRSALRLAARDALAEHVLEYACAGPLETALPCLEKAVQLPARNASLMFGSLSAWVDNYYVFSSIARDPAGVAQSTPSEFGLAVYDGKVDLVGGLRALSAKYAALAGDEPVSMLRAVAAANDLFVQSRDQHLRPYGGTVRGLGNLFVFLLEAGTSKGVSFTVSLDGKGFNWQPEGAAEPVLVSAVSGLEPMEWATRKVVGADVVPCWGGITRGAEKKYKGGIGNGYKGLGNRVADFLLAAGKFRAPGFSATFAGDLSRLEQGPINVSLANGTTVSWEWSTFGLPPAGPLTPDPSIQALNDALALTGLNRADLAAVAAPLASGASSALALETSARAAVAVAEEPAPVAASLAPSEDTEFISSACPADADYCVLKLTTFEKGDIPAATYAAHFNKVARAAKASGVRKLFFDVVNNGGGNIPLGTLAVKSLLGALPDERICDMFVRKLGPVDQFLKDRGIEQSADFEALLNRLITDTPALESYATELAAHNCTGLERMLRHTSSIFDALGMLGKSRGSAPPNLSSLSSAAQQALKTCRAGGPIASQPPNVDASAPPTYGVADYLRAISQSLATSVYGASPNDTVNLTSYTVQDETLNYTFPSRSLCYSTFLDFPTVAQQLEPSPFTQVLALSDGLCGSTCGFFSLTALFNSIADPTLPTFRIVVFGGTGAPPTEQNLTATVYQGGNVWNSDESYQKWTLYAVLAAFIHASGSFKTPQFQDVDSLAEMIPMYNPYNGGFSAGNPEWSARANFMAPLGPDSLPSEYYLQRDNFYLREWFYDTGVNGTDLPKLYTSASQFFKR